MISNSNYLSIGPLDLGSQQWKDSRLTQLELTKSGQSLKGEIPQSVGNVVQLTSLISKKNKFTGSIPDTIKHLINLTKLEFTLSELGGKIPVIIGNLTNLEELNLANNKFTG